MSDFESLVEILTSDPQVVQAKWFGKPCIAVERLGCASLKHEGFCDFAAPLI